ncbi:SAM-dependent methyltransferase [Amycolatopsis aidingensis]|uniref:SAM-dependent methyltransferase n=1 Tax=Amycolatopsis aidingensis TaxID=2842453 RepID=UPI001C0C230F|nr:cyclopropane-fatty-acyl-phospholipid synthase family protein [Amycolatopsis aidingensis]
MAANRRGAAAERLESVVRELFGVGLPVGLTAWDGSSAGPADGPRVLLRNRRALRHVLYSPGELGLARAFVRGDLDVEGDLTEGLRRCWELADVTARRPGRLGPAQWALLLRTAIGLGVLGPRPRRPTTEARPRGVLHSRRRDRAVIAHHYDAGNEFYEFLLDPRLAYSSGYWTSDDPSYTVANAQDDKLELVCRKLGLTEGMRLLDVGCGWGSLICYAAEHHGVRATGVTLSARQAEYARRRAGELGLADRVEVHLTDYRDLDGDRYDAVASIEMGEHVGAANYPMYAATLHRMLRPQGSLLLQQMSRPGPAPGGGAFIESYIAPDMSMVPVSRTLDHLERAGFEIRGVEAMREHYVRTVRAWAATLEQQWPEAVNLAGLEQARVWRLYLAGGALAFENNRMGVNQILARKV